MIFPPLVFPGEGINCAHITADGYSALLSNYLEYLAINGLTQVKAESLAHDCRI